MQVRLTGKTKRQIWSKPVLQIINIFKTYDGNKTKKKHKAHNETKHTLCRSIEHFPMIIKTTRIQPAPAPPSNETLLITTVTHNSACEGGAGLGLMRLFTSPSEFTELKKTVLNYKKKKGKRRLSKDFYTLAVLRTEGRVFGSAAAQWSDSQAYRVSMMSRASPASIRALHR